jgi:predicted esterase
MVLDNLEFVGKDTWIELLTKSQLTSIDNTIVKGFIEHVIQTNNREMPQITMFLRAPKGHQNFNRVKGIMAICVLANNIQHIRDGLIKENFNTETDIMTKYANERELAVLIWGSKSLWNKKLNWYDLPEDEYKEYDHNMDQVCEAWVKGVKELIAKYQIKSQRLLLDGYSGAAQFALRLAMRHPEIFLAVHAHVPTTFDIPIDNGKGTLWLLTTGLYDSGMNNMTKFYSAMRKRETPMILKVYPDAGHNRTTAAVKLSQTFFDYALSFDSSITAKLESNLALDNATAFPWYKDFSNPKYWTDWHTNSKFAYDETNELDHFLKSRKVPIPNTKLAEAWMINDVEQNKLLK